MSDLHLVDVPVPGGSAEAHLSLPPDGHGPGVLLVMDAIGLRPQIAAMADRIASWGYVVLAPNVFHREGTVAELLPTGDLRTPEGRDAVMAEAMPRVRRLTSDLSRPDVVAVLDHLRGLDATDAGPVAVVGYCMGARIALRAAGDHSDVVAACGGFHGGGLVTDEPDSPHLSLATARAEVVLGHADRDRSMPPEAVTALGAALEEAGLPATNAVYPDAPHGYSMADTAMYQEAGAERHFRELEALLSRRLGGPAADG
ncbi:dienelactone hydrolase family protein [Phycicoccus sonneratiae]|uniref:Dienelactone hydrolase family protein n=1 Tax=Phycicoccus sonneratiae TaxID=2807628 RepID=A0ABS2CRC2_9MICO|nr:dienelactone hydrolase family protein [Phycicoccus sonneraticus]MBM6402441.1 dienelactone hydrolase family protein [Phycicoccus sonneraticus]